MFTYIRRDVGQGLPSTSQRSPTEIRRQVFTCSKLLGMSDSTIGLSDLIRQHQQRTGDSFADLARASGISKARIGQLADSASIHMPRHDTVAKLSRALHLPLRVVQSAAMVSAGISPETASSGDRVSLLAALLADLPEQDLRYVEVFVGALTADAMPRG